MFELKLCCAILWNMIKFKYQALQDNTKIIKGEIEAQNLREARELIRKLGFIPTKVYTEVAVEQTKVVEVNEKPILKTQVKNLSLVQKINFTSQLETLLSAGIPILEALQCVENNSSDLKLKTICANISDTIASGMTFAQSLKNLYGSVFGVVYTSLVKTGEDAGELEATLQRMLILLRKQEAIKDKIVSASIYPAVLLSMMTGLSIIFAKFVFPKFAEVMTFNGADLPFLAQSIMGFFNFIDNFWWLVLILIGATCYVVMQLFKNPQIKSKWDEFVLKIPVISDFITYINLSNFMTVMHISYDAGVPIMSGLELANKTIGNYTIKSKIFTSVNLIRAGKTLTEAFNCAGVIPSALISMISAGEKSGFLGKMFHDCADVIDKKVDMALEAMTKLFEPAVILIMGGAVLLIAIAFFQAYVGMLGSLF